MIAGFVGFIAFLALTKSAGFTQGSDSPDIRAGLKPSSLMADATGWTGLMGLIGIASIGSVHGYLLIGYGATWLVFVGLGTLVRKFVSPAV